MANTIPSSALKHLEPRSGGQWTVSAETESTFTLSYVMDDGLGISYTMHRYTTLNEVDSHSNNLVYKFTGAPELDGETEYNRPPPSDTRQPDLGYPMLSPMHIILRPQAQEANPETQSSLVIPGTNSSANFEQDHFSSISQSQVPPQQSHHFFPGQVVPHDDIYRQDQLSGPNNTPTSQQAPQDPATAPMAWPMDMFPTNSGLMTTANGMLVDNNQNLQGEALFQSPTWGQNWPGMPNPANEDEQSTWGMGFTT